MKIYFGTGFVCAPSTVEHVRVDATNPDTRVIWVPLVHLRNCTRRVVRPGSICRYFCVRQRYARCEECIHFQFVGARTGTHHHTNILGSWRTKTLLNLERPDEVRNCRALKNDRIKSHFRSDNVWRLFAMIEGI